MPAPLSPPRLPPAVPRLLGLLPQQPHNAVLALCLNRLFGDALAFGELDFLLGRVLRLTVTDAGASASLSLGARRRLFACHDWRRPDAEVEGTLYDFLLLASGREDPDTLFFQRRLRLAGDVELALAVKNFLQAREPSPVERRALAVAERLIGALEQRRDRSVAAGP